MATWKKVIVSGSDAELNSLSIDSSLLVSGSSTLSSSLLVIGDTIVTGSLFVTGSDTQLDVNYFTVLVDSVSVLQAGSASGVEIADVSGNASIDAQNRQLIKADGTTVSVDWEEGIFSGSFSGSFQGDGSGLTNLNVVSSAIYTGSVTASVDTNINTFTIVSGSDTFLRVRNNAGLEHGIYVTASGLFSHAEGEGSLASATGSHAEGFLSIASGIYSHAEGNSSATGTYSHAEGSGAAASGEGSHAEGGSTTASGTYSHAEGFGAEAKGYGSHAEGYETKAVGLYSHAEGEGTIASGSAQLAAGKYNTQGNTTSLVVIGNGADGSNRSDLAKFNTSDIQFSSSFYVTGSNVSIDTDVFQVYLGNSSNVTLLQADATGVIVYDTIGSTSADFNTRTLTDSINVLSADWSMRQLYDSSGAVAVVDWNANALTDNANGNISVDWENRQLIKSDGTTVSVDWENGIFSGSFSGSFEGDGSGLTGITATSLANSLTQGTGITTFTFDGSSAQTVSVSGSDTLTSNYITKWTGDAFANTTITDDGSLVTFTQDAVFQGDITVQGTASFQNTENLLVADRFALFASGSSTTGDGGIVVQQGTQNIGELYGYDSGVQRWGFTSSFDASTTSYTPDAFVAAVIDLQEAGHADVARYQKNGNIKIDNGDIYIYS